MKEKNTRFRLLDALYIAMMIVPLLACMVLKVLTTPQGEGITISGAQIYLTIPMPVMDLTITASQITSWAVMIAILGLCLYLTHGLTVKPESKRQLVAEWAVEKVNGLVSENMGQRFMAFAPFIASIMLLSAFSSLTSLLGLFPPTSDMNVVAGWAILVFVLITHYKLKGGVWPYVKGFFEPVPVFAPFNIIGEIATPISMAFRHYGNVLSGSVISVLLAAALGGLSVTLFGNLPGILGKLPQVFPILRVGIPAILSLYFDIFSGCLQAFIFAMLTMLYVAGAFPAEDYARKMEKIKNKNKKTN